MANRNSKRTNLVFVILLLAGAFLVFLQPVVSVRIIKALVYYMIYPSVSAANMVIIKTGDVADNIKSMVYVHQENLKYKQENQQLIDKLRHYDAMSVQYNKLIDLIRVPSVQFTRMVFASISVREPNEWYQWIIISKGKNDGFYDELPLEVLTKDGQLCAVGRIVETYDGSAKAALITNVLSVVPVKIKNKNINCLAEGTNTRTLKITYIPFNADVREGDEVVVSGLSSVFSEETPVGVIRSVSKGQTVDFKTATAEIYFESNISQEVIVLIPDKEIK
ncbi:MAG: rod shape-determining protein MreC [Elusimicrobiota bacterium]|jgi:rod shape-determining protein MreC|nr:rod shape-determining protein MreC [Elusimicrobiota bacterium]